MPEQLPQATRDLCAAAVTLADTVLADSTALDRNQARTQIVAAAKAAGLYTLTQPAAFGGSEADQLTLCAVRDALASRNPANAQWVFGPGPGVLANVDGALRQQYLQPLLAGHKTGGFGLTEPDDAPHYTRAIRDGDALVIDGQKSYVTGGDHADFINTLVRLDDAPVLVVVDTNRPGVSKTRVFRSIDGSHHAAFRFQGVRVPASHMIGKPGDGMPRALGQIGDTRLAIAATCVGQLRWVYDYLTNYLSGTDRRGKPRGDAAVARLRLGQVFAAGYAARSTLYRTARLIDSGANAVNEAMASKVLATQALSTAVDEAIQLVGGGAVVEDHPLAILYQKVRSLRLAEGATDVLFQNIARGRLELHKGEL